MFVTNTEQGVLKTSNTGNPYFVVLGVSFSSRLCFCLQWTLGPLIFVGISAMCLYGCTPTVILTPSKLDRLKNAEPKFKEAPLGPEANLSKLISFLVVPLLRAYWSTW